MSNLTSPSPHIIIFQIQLFNIIALKVTTLEFCDDTLYVIRYSIIIITNNNTEEIVEVRNR